MLVYHYFKRKNRRITTEYQLQVYGEILHDIQQDLYGVKIPVHLSGQYISHSDAIRVEGSRDENRACRVDLM